MSEHDADALRTGRSRPLVVLVALGIATLLAFVASLLTGPADFGLPAQWAALAGAPGAESEAIRAVLIEIRLPRALLGLLIGATLGTAGAALQGYLRNPLAEPGLIGISGGAALGAVIAIHTGLAATAALALPLAGLAGAFAATLAVLALGGLAGGALSLILAGVAVTSLTGALTALALNLSDNPFAATEILFWLMGALTDRGLQHVALAAPLMLVGMALLLVAGPRLDALSLGDDVAASMGIDLVRTRALILAGTALSVGAATAVAGTIGFVGLVVPHLLRPLVANLPGRLLPASLLGGALLVLLADLVVRQVTAIDLRLGVLTSLLGAPFFLMLVLRSSRELAS